MSRFEKLCWFYRLYYEKYLELINNGFNIPLFKFEDIIANEKEQLRILETLGISNGRINSWKFIYTEKKNSTKNTY